MGTVKGNNKCKDCVWGICFNTARQEKYIKREENRVK